MELFGGAKIVAGHREAPKAGASAGDVGVILQKILKIRRSPRIWLHHSASI